MAKNLNLSINFADLQEKLTSQFRDLDPKDPSLWPSIPRYFLLIAVASFVVGLLWFAWLSGSQETLQAEQDKEVVLREDYKKK